MKVPVVDLSSIQVPHQRKKIVDEIRQASENWGIFQVINHGIPSSVLEGMIDGARKFHEQDIDLKKEYYSSDPTTNVRYVTSRLQAYLSQSSAAPWKDALFINGLLSGHIEPEEIPAVCRKTSLEYTNHVVKLGKTLFEILSEALGLKSNHLNAMGCAKGQGLVCHYYPACPQPELTLGSNKHRDPALLAILLQDLNGGLQVMHNNKWVDVEPIERGLVVNIGDFLQILSNDKFVSAPHRVQVNKVGSRISVGCFFLDSPDVTKIYGPIKELISDEKPPVYKQFLATDFINKYLSMPLDKPCPDLFKL